MKFILVLLVVLGGIWLWRSNRQADAKLRQQNTKTATAPLDMVRCALCEVHVPSVDALVGKKGSYCCKDHLRRAEP